jgi:signal transduction histidine kinase
VTIRGFVGFIERDAGTGNLERVRADIGRIRTAAETMTALLNQILELSRVGRVVGPREVLPLGVLVREAAQRVAGIEKAELIVAPELPTVQGDRIRLIEVFENLLTNALKFMGPQAAPRIEVGVRPGPEPVVYVADNGVGIRPQFQQKVFALFERLDSRVEGTGVGLAIAKRVVEFHGGRIWVESEGVPGKGSVFCLVLPRPAARDAEPRPPER